MQEVSKRETTQVTGGLGPLAIFGIVVGAIYLFAFIKGVIDGC